MRVRGGIEYNSITRNWQAVVHVWDDDQGHGTPDHVYTWPETYATESLAEQAYQVHARPALVEMLAAIQRTPGATAKVNRWDWQEVKTPDRSAST